MNNVPQQQDLALYADNCPAQNKNHTMIEYLTYLVKVKKAYKSITLNFLLSGHTKFTPDGHFGRANHIKKHDTQSILSFVGKDGLIQTSARNNYKIPCKDPHSGTQNFVFYD